jgi:hypothetical protein
MAQPTKSNIAWPQPSSTATGPRSSNYRSPDRFEERLSYRRGSRSDPVLAGKARVIIPHNGKSFGAPA